QKQCFLHECDHDQYGTASLPGNIENIPNVAAEPIVPTTSSPPTVNEADRRPRHISLPEAISMALENGIDGNITLTGTFSDFVGNFPATAGVNFFAGDNAIRVLALDPAIVGADIEASLAKFDARWVTSMAWQKIERAIGGNLIQSFQNGDQATL